MIGPLSRIAARWVAGGLVMSGLLLPADAQIIATDPDVIAIIGLAIGAITEFAYAQAKKRGWAT